MSCSRASIVLIAVSAFFTYARFRLLVSARTGLWMLGQGVRRWFNVLFVALAGLLFLSHGNIDFQQWRAVLVEWIGVSLVLQVSGLAVLRRIAYNINNSPSNKRRAVFFSLGPKAKEMALVIEAQGLAERDIPEYVAVDGNDKVTFTRVPTLDEVPYPVKMEPNLVVEFYSR